MGILNALKSAFRGAANIPKDIRGAMYNYEDVMAPDYESRPGYQIMGPAGGIMDIPGSDGPTGTQSKIGERRTGLSGFGKFMQALPRMVSAGAAAASAPGRGQGGFAEVLRGMDIGGQRIQQNDAIAANFRRQRMQDELHQREANARIAENEAQAQNYWRQANAGPPPQKPPTHSTMEAALVAQWEAEPDPAKKDAIAKRINDLKHGGKAPNALMNVGGAIYDPGAKTWMQPPKQADPTKETPEQTRARWREEAKRMTKATAYQREQYEITGKLVPDPARNPRRGGQQGASGPSSAQSSLIERRKQDNLRDAETNARKKTAAGTPPAQAFAELEEEKKQIYRAYDEEIVSAGGSIAPRRTVPVLGRQAAVAAPKQNDPLGIR